MERDMSILLSKRLGNAQPLMDMFSPVQPNRLSSAPGLPSNRNNDAPDTSPTPNPAASLPSTLHQHQQPPVKKMMLTNHTHNIQTSNSNRSLASDVPTKPVTRSADLQHHQEPSASARGANNGNGRAVTFAHTDSVDSTMPSSSAGLRSSAGQITHHYNSQEPPSRSHQGGLVGRNNNGGSIPPRDNTNSAASRHMPPSAKPPVSSAANPLPPTMPIHNAATTAPTLTHLTATTLGKPTRPPQHQSITTSHVLDPASVGPSAPHSLIHPQQPTEHPKSSYQYQFIESIIEDALSEFKKQVRNDLQNMHLEMLKEFQDQRIAIEDIIQRNSPVEPLLQEIRRLNEENERLRKRF
ncbi:hypothetical protein SeLEV6574_g06512 [Synchytrium endobioticum]|nr:hypothetical protein SeLEV6574_g06512 [Synchytrium endobioticum]